MSEIITFNTDSISSSPVTHTFDILPLVHKDDPILRQVMPEFDFTNTSIDVVRLASQLVETCKKNNGLGLSANQCGLKYRVFVMGTGEEYVAFFNPTIVEYSNDEVLMQEGCLSFPMLALNIKRPSVIKVEYQNYMGEKKTATFSGLSARCFLHELDHMDGIVYTDKVKPLALKMGLKKKDKIKRLMEKANKSLQKMEKINNGYAS